MGSIKEKINIENKPGNKLNFYLNNPLKDEKVTIYTVISDMASINLNTINSVLNQTFIYFEWIICGNKQNIEFVENYLKENKCKDSRIKLLVNNSNDISELKLQAVKSSSTEYLFPLEWGSFIDNTLIETMYFLIDNNDIALIYSNTITTGNELELCDKWSKTNSRRTVLIPKSSFLYRKTAIINISKEVIGENSKLIDELIKIKAKLAKLNFYGVWFSTQDNYYSVNLNKSDLLAFPLSDTYDYDTEPYCFPEIKNPVAKKEKTLLCLMPWAKMGGAELFNLNIFRYLKNKGYKIIVMTTNVLHYDWRSDFESIVDEYFDLTTFLPKKQWPGFINHIINNRNVDLIFQLSSLYGYYVMPWIKHKYPKLPIIDYLHCENDAWRNGGYPKDSNAISHLLDKTYTCTKYLIKYLFDKGREDKNVEAAYIGLDPSKYDPDNTNIIDKDTYNLCKGKKVLLYPGRFVTEKRPIFLLYLVKELLKERQDIVCLMVGEGPLLGTIKSYIKKLNLENYVYLIPKTSYIQQYYKMADITIICSLVEGLTLTTYESLAMKVPVISADVGGQKEVVGDDCGKIIKVYQDIKKDLNNFNYDDEEINEYLTTIKEIFNKKDIKKFKNYCREKILASYTSEQTYEKIEKEIAKLIKSGSKVEVSKSVINEQYAIRYLVLYNETSKEFFNNVFAYNSFKTKVREKMWKYPLWRKGVNFAKKINADKVVKKIFKI